MREIEFRGMSVKGQGEISYKIKWIYGFLAKDGAGVWIINTEMEWIEVNPDSVGQFTGLTDKNGVKIFEGDVIRFLTHDSVGVVIFHQLQFLADCKKRHHYLQGYEIEIIGNVFCP